MKYFLLIPFLTLAFFASVPDASAQLFCGGEALGRGECRYVPLEPLPVGNADAQSGANFPAFVSGLFRILITFGGLFAVVMLTVAGISYMLSESPLQVGKAKDRAKAALWGLLLLMGSWLILNAVNPDVLNFRLLVPSSTSNTNTQPAPLDQRSIDRLNSKVESDRVTLNPSEGQAFNDQETQFRNRCESQGGAAKVVGGDGVNTATYACEVPRYQP